MSKGIRRTFFIGLSVIALGASGCNDTSSSSLYQAELAKAQGVEDSGDCHENAEHAKRVYAGQDSASFAVVLEEPDFDFTRFEGATGTERGALIDERKTQLESSQAALQEHVERLGGEVVSSSWIVNQLNVVIPVRQLDALFAHELVVKFCGHAAVYDE